MRLQVEEGRHYNFPAIKRHEFGMRENRPEVVALVYIYGEVHCWEVVTTPVEAAGQLVAYYAALGSECRWIQFYRQSGFSNPDTPLPNQKPEAYLEEGDAFPPKEGE